MTSAVDISVMQIGDKVHRYVMARHYSDLLEALQDEARAFGYYFAMETTPGDAVALPDVVADALAASVAVRKSLLTSPASDCAARQRAERSIRSGFARTHLDALLEALGKLGIHVQQQADALDQTAAEIRRRQEAAGHLFPVPPPQGDDDSPGPGGGVVVSAPWLANDATLPAAVPNFTRAQTPPRDASSSVTILRHR